MKKQVKYALMGIGALAVLVIPLSAVLSCSQVNEEKKQSNNSSSSSGTTSSSGSSSSDSSNGTTSSSDSSSSSTNVSYDTNQVSAFSYLSNFNILNQDGTNLLNDISLGINGYSSDNLVQTMNNANWWKNYGISSVASWYFNSSGVLTGLGNLGVNSNFLNKDNGIASFLNTDPWLQQNNSILVSKLFTSILNYITGPLSLQDYLEQSLSSSTSGGAGLFKLLYWNNENSFKNLNFANFVQQISETIKNSDIPVSFYLRPAYIFYSVGTPNNSNDENATATPDLNPQTYWYTTQNYKNLPFNSILPGYMPVSTSGTTSTTSVANGTISSTVVPVSIAQIYNIRIVYEYYYYNGSSLVNATQSTSTNYNNYAYKDPYTNAYFSLNLSPIDVALRNLGLGSHGSGQVDGSNYAALNYYDNTNYFYPTKWIQYNWVTSNGSYESKYFNLSDLLNDTGYLRFLQTPASSWTFHSSSFTSIGKMYTGIEAQAKLFFTLSAYDQSTATGILSSYISQIKNYFNGGSPSQANVYYNYPLK